jgi:hypothetical protein
MAELQLNASGNASEGREGIHYISGHSDDKNMIKKCNPEQY